MCLLQNWCRIKTWSENGKLPWAHVVDLFLISSTIQSLQWPGKLVATRICVTWWQFFLTWAHTCRSAWCCPLPAHHRGWDKNHPSPFSPAIPCCQSTVSFTETTAISFQPPWLQRQFWLPCSSSTFLSLSPHCHILPASVLPCWGPELWSCRKAHVIAPCFWDSPLNPSCPVWSRADLSERPYICWRALPCICSGNNSSLSENVPLSMIPFLLPLMHPPPSPPLTPFRHLITILPILVVCSSFSTYSISIFSVPNSSPPAHLDPPLLKPSAVHCRS